MYLMRSKNLLSLVIAALLLSNCTNEPELKGERIPIWYSGDELKIAANEVEVMIPQEVRNDAWVSSAGIESSLFHNLTLGLPLKKQRSYSVTNFGDLHPSSGALILENRVVAIDGAGMVQAFADDTGKKVWKNDFFAKKYSGQFLNGGLTYGDADGGGVVYVTAGTDYVLAIDFSTGATIWSSQINGTTRSVPLIAPGVLVVQTMQNQTYGLSLTTGELIWTHEGNNEELAVMHSPSAALWKDMVVLQYNNGDIVALNAKDGEERWAAAMSMLLPSYRANQRNLYGVIGNVVIEENAIISFSPEGVVGVINPATAGGIWAKSLQVTKPFWVSGNMIFALAEGDRLLAIHKFDGRIKWVTNLADSKSSKTVSWTPPVVAGSKVIIVSSAGELLFIDPTTGAIDSKMKVVSGVFTAPMVVDGNLYLFSYRSGIVKYATK
jgi:outer membrane protein assembly factor BamB